MILKILLWLVLSCLSAWLYHKAGQGGFKNSKLLRRLGCNIITLWLFVALQGFQTLNLASWWAYVLFLVLNYLALSTYHDYLAPDKSSEHWLCWLATGFFYGASAFPLLWCGITIVGFVLRTLFLALGIMLVRENTERVEIEELGSGFLYTASMPLLLI